MLWIIGRAGELKLEREIDQPLVVPENFAQVQAGADLANLVANPVGNERRFGVVEDNAFLVVEPAWRLVYFGENGVHAERKNPVFQHSFLGIEHLALPGEVVDECGDLPAVASPGGDNRRAVGLAIGNIARSAVGEKLVELRLS